MGALTVMTVMIGVAITIDGIATDTGGSFNAFKKFVNFLKDEASQVVNQTLQNERTGSARCGAKAIVLSPSGRVSLDLHRRGPASFQRVDLLARATSIVVLQESRSSGGPALRYGVGAVARIFHRARSGPWGGGTHR